VARIVLFHSVQGLRRDVRDWAASLRDGGHDVWTPDLLDGATFERLEDGIAHRDEIGIPALMQRASAALEDLPPDLVYAGFSMGAATAQYFAATRQGTQAAILMHSALTIEDLEVEAWPTGLPVQIHYATGDPWVEAAEVASLEEAVRAAGGAVETYTYPGEGHLFADPDGPDYDQESAELMVERELAFLGEL
jgi:dienelactone hydrolase